MLSDGNIPHHVHQSLNLVFLRCVLSQGDNQRTPRRSSDPVFSARYMEHFSTGHGKSCCGKALQDRLCITHVISDLLLQLYFSLRRVNSLACSLYNVRSTVKLGSVASCPETVKLYAITHQFLRNNGKAKTNACKASILESFEARWHRFLHPRTHKCCAGHPPQKYMPHMLHHR